MGHLRSNTRRCEKARTCGLFHFSELAGYCFAEVEAAFAAGGFFFRK
jgi:hypothetical protein